MRHRPDHGVGVERIAQRPAARVLDEAGDEPVVDVGMHIDALDAAAALPGVEERAVDQVLDRMVELGVGAHIGRVLAAQFEPQRREGAGRGALDRGGRPPPSR